MLDGGEETKYRTYWTQNKNDLYPSMGKDPIFRIYLTAETEVTTENAIKLQPGIAETQVDPVKRTQIAYLKKGESLNLDITLAESYDVVFTPAVEFLKQDGKYVTTVDKNYNLIYNFAVSVPVSYEWYLNAETKTDGKKLYNIKNESDLKGFSNLVNGIDLKNSGQSAALNFKEETVNLIDNFEIKSANWTTIGTSGAAFSGTFDGNNHAVTGLRVSAMSDNQGLFGYVNEARIKNLTVTGIIDNNGQYTGGIVGCAVGNCSFENLQFGGDDKTKKAETTGRNNCTGGIVGGAILTSEGQTIEFKNCKNKGLIHGTSDAVGGIVGNITTNPNKIKVEAVFDNCENLGEVNGDTNYTGGIAGIVSSISSPWYSYISTRYDNNKNSGKVRGSQYTGGITGYLSGLKDKTSKVFNCYNTGIVSGIKENTGGVIGYISQYSDIKSCYNAGTVEGDTKTGGIVGSVGNFGSILSSYNSKSGTVEGDTNTGGIVGELNSNFGEVKYCYNEGSVKGNVENTGGIAGYATNSVAPIINNYNTGDAKGKNNVGGIIGKLEISNLKNNYNTGNILATGTCAGGIVGVVKKSGANVQSCYNTGKVECKENSAAAGGITGENAAKSDGWGVSVLYASSKVSGCYNTGDIVADKGLAGNITGRYFELNQDCYALNKTGSDKKYVNLVTKEQFESGELAYLLDGGSRQNRTTNWGQGENTPVFAEGENKEIYKLTINVSGKGSLSDGSTKNILDSLTKYIIKDTEVKLSAFPESGQKLLRLHCTGLNVLNQNNQIEFSMPNSDIEITAIFAEQNVQEDSIIVVFDANAGVFDDGKATATTIANNSGKLSFPNQPKKEGYTFKGWYDAKAGGNPVSEGIELTSDAYYYAQWTKDEGTFAEGTGSENDPFILSNSDDLYLLAGKVNSGDKNYIDKFYKIADDIDNINIGDDWEAIGTKKNLFSGSFDGNSALIKSNASTGLFGYVSNVNIRDFRLDADIRGGYMLGGVVNYFTVEDDWNDPSKKLNFENITVLGSISGTYAVGGLLGGTNGSRYQKDDLVDIKNCRNMADIYNSGVYTGGLVGYLYADFKLDNCINTGNVTCTIGTNTTTDSGRADCGGLAGGFNSGEVNQCVNTGYINAEGQGVGGLLGNALISGSSDIRSVKNSYNLGNISGDSDVGGIAGKFYYKNEISSIENCYNYGTISANINKAYGAISSDAGDKSVNCYTLEGTVYPKAKDKKQVKQMSKSSFESGEVAYLLDGGGTITRSAIWTQNVADGYPVFGTPSYYKLNVSGNEGEYTISVTGTNGADVKCGNGEIKDFYVGGGDKPLCVSVVGKSKTFMENGKKYQITYNVDSIELTKNEAKEDITATKTFKMQEDCTLKVTVKPSEKVEIVEQEKPSAGGGGNKGNGGSGDKGKGEGTGKGSEGTETGKGEGTGEAAGNQKGSGDIVGSSSGGEKESNYASTTIIPTTTTSNQVETKEESPMIEQEQQNDTDEDDESVEAANSGGLEEGIKAGEAEQDDEEDEQITVWEIVKQKVKDNPMMLVFVCLVIAAIVGMGGLARLKKSRRL